MSVMLDTNVSIYLIKEHPASVLDPFTAHPVGDIGVSVVTLAELAARCSITGFCTRSEPEGEV